MEMLPVIKRKNEKVFWTLNLNLEESKQRQCQYTLAFSSKAVFAFSEGSKHIKCTYTFDFLKKIETLAACFSGRFPDPCFAVSFI
jgi:hypothetical protein